MTTFHRFTFDNYQIIVEKMPEVPQPEITKIYDKACFYDNYIAPIYRKLHDYVNENGLKLKYTGYLDKTLSSIFFYELDYELRKMVLHRRGYACDWFFETHFRNLHKFSDRFIRVLEDGTITWNEVTELVKSEKFISLVIEECKTFLVAE